MSQDFLALMKIWSDDVMLVFFLFVSYGLFGVMLRTSSIFSIDLPVVLVRISKNLSSSLRCSRYLVRRAISFLCWFFDFVEVPCLGLFLEHDYYLFNMCHYLAVWVLEVVAEFPWY